jgi:ABC-type metal ion transport system substrate-binding protein
MSGKTKVKLAEALLRRKELQEKVNMLRVIKEQDLFETKTARKPAHEGLDDIIAKVPKLSVNEVTHAFDWHARQLREVDACIQQANWVTEVEVNEAVMGDYVAPKQK